VLSKEAQRFQVPRCDFEETIKYLTEEAQSHPTERVFNLDEVGIYEWEDRPAKNAIIPVSARGQGVHHKVNRSSKHLSVIACVSAARESLTLYAVTPRSWWGKCSTWNTLYASL
jgi:hypothetical protein